MQWLWNKSLKLQRGCCAVGEIEKFSFCLVLSPWKYREESKKVKISGLGGTQGSTFHGKLCRLF